MRLMRCVELITLAKAAALQEPSHYQQLNAGRRRRLAKRLSPVVALVSGGAISSAADLHTYHCQKLADDGWQYGPVWRPLRGLTPSLTHFDQLQQPARQLVELYFAALSAAATSFADRITPPGKFKKHSTGVDQ